MYVFRSVAGHISYNEGNMLASFLWVSLLWNVNIEIVKTKTETVIFSHVSNVKGRRGVLHMGLLKDTKQQIVNLKVPGVILHVSS